MPRGAREFSRPLFAQRLVDLVGVLIQRRRQVSPSFRRLTVGGPLRIRAASGTLGGLLPEKSRHLLVGAAIGIGEQAVIPTAPAILNAIHDAVGVRIQKTPATPDRVRAAILAKARGGARG